MKFIGPNGADRVIKYSNIIIIKAETHDNLLIILYDIAISPQRDVFAILSHPHSAAYEICTNLP